MLRIKSVKIENTLFEADLELMDALDAFPVIDHTDIAESEFLAHSAGKVIFCALTGAKLNSKTDRLNNMYFFTGSPFNYRLYRQALFRLDSNRCRLLL